MHGDINLFLQQGFFKLLDENAGRFLTDHLSGDTYFRIHRPGHNQGRARVQLRLTEQLLAGVDEARRLVEVEGRTRQ